MEKNQLLSNRKYSYQPNVVNPQTNLSFERDSLATIKNQYPRTRYSEIGYSPLLLSSPKVDHKNMNNALLNKSTNYRVPKDILNQNQNTIKTPQQLEYEEFKKQFENQQLYGTKKYVHADDYKFQENQQQLELKPAEDQETFKRSGKKKEEQIQIQIDNYKQQCQELEIQFIQLKEEYNLLKQQTPQVITQIEQVRVEVIPEDYEETKYKLIILNEQYQSLKNQPPQIITQIEQVIQREEVVPEDYEVLRNGIDIYQHQCQELEDQLIELQQEYEVLKNKPPLVMTQIEQSIEKVDVTIKDYDENKEKLSILIEQYEKLQNQKPKVITKIEKVIPEDYKELKRMNQEYQSQITQFEITIFKEREEKSDLQSIIQSQLHQFREQFDQLKNQPLQVPEDYEVLKKQCSEYQQQISILKKKQQPMSPPKNEQLLARLSTVKEVPEDEAEEYKKLYKEQALLVSQLQLAMNSEKEEKDIIKRHGKKHEEGSKELEQQLSQIKKEFAAYKNAPPQVIRETVEVIPADYDEIKYLLRNITEEFLDLMKSSQNSTPQLSSHIEAIIQRLEIKPEDFQQLKKQCSELKYKLKEECETVKRLEKKHEEDKQQQQIQIEIQALQISDLQSQLTKEKETVKRLEKNHESERQQLQNQIDFQALQISDLQSQLTQLSEINQQLKDQPPQIITQIQHVVEKIDVLPHDYDEIKQNLSQFQEQLKDYDSTKNNLQLLQIQNSKLTSKLSTIRSNPGAETLQLEFDNKRLSELLNSKIKEIQVQSNNLTICDSQLRTLYLELEKMTENYEQKCQELLNLQKHPQYVPQSPNKWVPRFSVKVQEPEVENQEVQKISYLSGDLPDKKTNNGKKYENKNKYLSGKIEMYYPKE